MRAWLARVSAQNRDLGKWTLFWGDVERADLAFFDFAAMYGFFPRSAECCIVSDTCWAPSPGRERPKRGPFLGLSVPKPRYQGPPLKPPCGVPGKGTVKDGEIRGSPLKSKYFSSKGQTIVARVGAQQERHSDAANGKMMLLEK